VTGRRWFQHPSTLIALLALLVSLGSTVTTIENNRSQAANMARQQLLMLVQGLTQVPQVQTQISSTYKNDVQARINLAGSEATAELIQAELATQLIESLHRNVAPSEAYEVAIALGDRGDLTQALRYYGVAIHQSAADPVVLAGAYRGQAGVYYSLGRLRQAFATISRAYTSESAGNGFTPAEVEQNRIFTDLYDIVRAVNVHACTRSQSELADAARLTTHISASSNSYTQDLQQLRGDEALVQRCTQAP
jgi:tetratricopeptide (TPR) repeat protein